MPAKGQLQLDQLAEMVRQDEIETVVVGFTDLYGRLVGKRFDADFFLESAAAGGTHGCNYLLTVDMEMEPVAGYAFANWEAGYGDVHLLPDLSTLRRASWLENTALVLCDLVGEEEHNYVPQAPRSILRRQLVAAAEQGYSAMAASELEFYLYETSYRDAARQGYHELSSAGWYVEDYHILQGARVEKFNAPLRRHLRDSGVPVENSKGEWGLGQHEVNVRYADVLEMADRHCIYKQCAKELADQLGMSVTFMAKPASDQAGSSCHLHISLWQQSANAFAGDDRFEGIECSDAFRWFLGGWIAHAVEVMPFYAPNGNSYKRYRDASWAPTRLAWSYDNRTAGFRIVGSGPSLRIECRIPGADCNPYLAFAAALASGLDGIANRIEPPPMFRGDAYAARDLPSVPPTLRDATDLFECSPFARAAFGDDVVEHYTHFFRVEQQAAERAVTDWDRRRYFERV